MRWMRLTSHAPSVMQPTLVPIGARSTDRSGSASRKGISPGAGDPSARLLMYLTCQFLEFSPGQGGLWDIELVVAVMCLNQVLAGGVAVASLDGELAEPVMRPCRLVI